MKTRSERTKDLAERSRFWIDDLHVQPDRCVVMRDGEEIKLEKRLMQVLVELAENDGKPVSTGALLKEFWSDDDGNELYDENPVTKAISTLRRKIKDDARTPRYIKTIIKLGYCIIPKVKFAEGYRHADSEFGTWTRGNPYVGLKSYDHSHADVFQGRSATVADLMQAMREQIDNERRFVLVVGPSGCGKTSLIHASIIPTISKHGGFDGLRAISVAICDPSTTSDVDPMNTLVASLAGWEVGDRKVFSLISQEYLRKILIESPEKVTDIIEDSFRRHPVRGTGGQVHAHLLLIIDHAEVIVSDEDISSEQISLFARAIRCLCRSQRTLTIMISRLDFYPALISALPELADYRSGHGHFEVTMPSEGELAKIIRKPAALAGVNFEEHPKNQVFLDDMLCKKAIAQPDALPLLQHTLHSLYEKCGRTGVLTFAAFDEIGGLEGAIARRAEQVFGELPATVQGSLESILSRLVVIQPDSGAVSARPVLRNLLEIDARQLAQAFVDAHLFVSDLDGGQPIVKVAHEALLRQWPRAADWIKENRRLLQAKARLQNAAERWDREGRRDDHLLNPGRPLSESREVITKFPDDFKSEVYALIAASGRSDRRRRNLRRFAVALLGAFGITAAALAIEARRASNEAESRRIEAQDANTFMLKEIARNLEHLADPSLLEKISEQAISVYGRYPPDMLSIEDRINFSRALRIRGRVRMGREQWQPALEDFRRAESIAAQAVAADHGSIDAQFEFAQTSYWIGHLRMDQKRFDEATKHLIDYRDRVERLRSIGENDPEWIMEESYSYNNLATLSWKTGKNTDALAQLERSLMLKKEAIGIDSRAEWRKEVAVTLSWIGMALESAGRLDEAAWQHSASIEELSPIVSANSDNKEWAGQLANFRQLQSLLSLSRGQPERAKHSIAAALETLEPLATGKATDYKWIYYLASAHQIAGDCDRALGNRRSAAAHYAESLEILKRISGDEVDAKQQRLQAIIELGRIRMLDDTMDFDRLEAIVATLDRLHAHSPDDTHILTALSDALLLSADRLNAKGEFERARERWGKVLRISEAKDTSGLSPQLMAADAIARLRLHGSAVAAEEIGRLARIGYRHPDYLALLKASR